MMEQLFFALYVIHIAAGLTCCFTILCYLFFAAALLDTALDNQDKLLAYKGVCMKVTLISGLIFLLIPDADVARHIAGGM